MTRYRSIIPWLTSLCALGPLCLAAPSQTQAPPGLVDPAAILASLEAAQPGARKNAPRARPQAAGATSFDRSEYSLQITGALTPGTGALTTKVQPGSLGFLLGARFHLNPWEALEFELQSTSGGAPFAAGTAAPVPTRVTRFSLNEVLSANVASSVAPFLVAGGGLADFQGTSQDGTQSTSQIRPVGVLGAGMDMRIVHMGFRAEVETLFYRRPASGAPGAPSGWARLVQPSVGLIFSF